MAQSKLQDNRPPEIDPKYRRVMRWSEALVRLPVGSCSMVEVGVWQGGMCSRVLAAHPQVHMHLVDAWQAPEPGSSFYESGAEQARKPQSAYTRAYTRTKKRLRPFRQRVTIYPVDSAEAAQCIPETSVDLVFIDGDHSYDGIRSDIDSWLPKVKPGGWIGGHDYGHERYPGVAQAVSEQWGCAFELGGDRTWWHHKEEV